jgi:hypothetical protein
VLRVVRLLIVTLVGAALGLGTVWFALGDPRVDFAQRIGGWRVSVGAGTGDPYAAARIARAGLVGLGAAEGVAFVAREDADGRRLDPACHYLLEGPVPPGDLWTLTVTDEQGRPPRNPARRIGFTSRDVIRNGDGTVSITLGRTARPGNFLPAGDLASLVVTLRIYDSGLSARLPRPADMPVVRRTECAGRPNA